MVTMEEFERTVTENVVAGLHRTFADYEHRGVSVCELGDPDQWVSRILAGVPVFHPWYEQFGACWSSPLP